MVSDFESFRSAFHWDLIAMVESICYVKIRRAASVFGAHDGDAKSGAESLYFAYTSLKASEYVEMVVRLYPHTEKVDEYLFCISSSKPDDDRQCVNSGSVAAELDGTTPWSHSVRVLTGAQ